MRAPKPRYFRNRLDLTDHVQVRVLRKRLRISEAELTQMASKLGNSISAINKEVNHQRLERLST
jgi:DNA polymerase III delta subunit